MTQRPGQERLTVVPLSLADACTVVDRLHRHHKRPAGHKFSLGVLRPDGTLCGAAIIGRPVARALDTGWQVEITRVATDGTPNACSALYGAAWRTASAAGYLRAITYTQDGETGASLRGAGWTLVAALRPRKGWDTPSRARTDRGTDGIGRSLWEKSCADSPALPSLAELRNAIRNETTCPAPGCGRPVTQAARGRPARYCSPACRVRAHRRRTAAHTTGRTTVFVQNTSSLLDGPEPEPSPAAAGPELKRCVRCGRLGTRLFQTTPDGHICTARAACIDRQLATR